MFTKFPRSCFWIITLAMARSVCLSTWSADAAELRCYSATTDNFGYSTCIKKQISDLPKDEDLTRVKADPKAKDSRKPRVAPVRPVSTVEPPPPIRNAVIRGFAVALGPCERGTAQGYIEQIPNCLPGDPPAPLPTAQQYGLAFLAEIQTHAPRPILHVAPGWAIVGKYAYLEASGDLTYNNANAVIAWSCKVASSSTNWGDDNTETINRQTTGPWPDGSARHVYINKGHYPISVNETWTCDIDTPTGFTVLPLTTTTPPLNLRADEIQAVGVN